MISGILMRLLLVSVLLVMSVEIVRSNMRNITYILGAVAGFFTFGGIGLIVKGYQVEGGITLIIGLLSLIQFIRFLKKELTTNK